MAQHACVLSHSVVSDFVMPWTVAHQAPLSTGFSRQEYWSGLPFPSPRGTFGGRRKAVRDRLALQGGTGDFP